MSERSRRVKVRGTFKQANHEVGGIAFKDFQASEPQNGYETARKNIEKKRASKKIYSN